MYLKKIITILFCLFPVSLAADLALETEEVVETGKVVFKIEDAYDDMYEFAYDAGNNRRTYDVYAGCKYLISITNNTKHSVKIRKFSIRTDRVDEYYDFLMGKTSDIDTNIYKFVEPGEEYIVDDWATLNGLVFRKEEPLTEKPKKLLDEKLSKELAEKFGCKSQFGSVHVYGYFPEIVLFPDEANIKIRDSYKLLVGSPSGVFPLNELIKPF